MVYTPGLKSAFVALNRFGFGARPGDLAKAASDPRGFLKAELARPDAALVWLDDPANSDLVGTTPALQGHFAAEAQRKLAREAKAATVAAMPAPGAGGMEPAAGMAMPALEMLGPALPMQKPKPEELPYEQKVFRTEERVMAQKILDADTGFVERLVRFWSNHFCVSVAKSQFVRVAAGAFEREAIRPFVLGSFSDMLLAVERHPVMLHYLDNQQSIGPNSKAGRNRGKGLNENLAREILELHTLGVDGGYSQTDVTALARIITGWTIVARDGRLGEPGAFVFNANAHEPGDQMLLGKAYLHGGMGQGEAALNTLARLPATAHHLAFKLARHFIADAPPPALVDRLAKIFLDRDGDLKAMALALIDAPEAWDAPLEKLRSPFDFIMAIRRATQHQPFADALPLLNPVNALGQPLWQPPGPNGFADVTAAWMSAEGMKLRLDTAAQIAHQLKDLGNPSDLLNELIGEAASPETRQAVARAESREQGLALLFMSPEFQRR